MNEDPFGSVEADKRWLEVYRCRDKSTLEEADAWIAGQLRASGYVVERQGVPVQAFGFDATKPKQRAYARPARDAPWHTAYNLYAKKAGRRPYTDRHRPGGTSGVSPFVLLAVFVGGGTGAVCRHGVGRFVGERYSGDFPLGTYVINVSGCFALALLASLLPTTNANATWLLALLGTGFLGGFTTFSTYALEGVLLALDGNHRLAVVNLLGSIVAGLAAAAVGAAAVRLVTGA